MDIYFSFFRRVKNTLHGFTLSVLKNVGILLMLVSQRTGQCSERSYGRVVCKIHLTDRLKDLNPVNILRTARDDFIKAQNYLCREKITVTRSFFVLPEFCFAVSSGWMLISAKLTWKLPETSTQEPVLSQWVVPGQPEVVGPEAGINGMHYVEVQTEGLDTRYVRAIKAH